MVHKWGIAAVLALQCRQDKESMPENQEKLTQISVSSNIMLEKWQPICQVLNTNSFQKDVYDHQTFCATGWLQFKSCSFIHFSKKSKIKLVEYKLDIRPAQPTPLKKKTKNRAKMREQFSGGHKHNIKCMLMFLCLCWVCSIRYSNTFAILYTACYLYCMSHWLYIHVVITACWPRVAKKSTDANYHIKITPHSHISHQVLSIIQYQSYILLMFIT